jgi:outer membrane protein assembly factor BamA
MRSLVIVVLVAACGGPAPAVRAPSPRVCRPNVIGHVSIAGGGVADIPQLAVLEGTLDDQARIERVREASIDLLHTRGYPRAYIGILRQPGCGVELAISVVRGPRFRIAAIDFQTSPDDRFPAAQRAALLEDALGTVNAIGGAYVEDRLVRALDLLRECYRRAGYADAAIAPPRAVFDDSRGTVHLTIAIRPGGRS